MIHDWLLPMLINGQARVEWGDEIMGNSLVLKLQAEVMESNCDILNALRRAHLIASKLNLKEFDGWIQMDIRLMMLQRFPIIEQSRDLWKLSIRIVDGYLHN